MKDDKPLSKYDQLCAIATFKFTGMIDGVGVSPATAKVIVDFHDDLATAALKKQFMSFSLYQMKMIATGKVPTQDSFPIGIKPTMEFQVMINFAKMVYNGNKTLVTKYGMPAIHNAQKAVGEFLENRKKKKEEVPKL